ncbi:GNAT family N-acetyltransferase [Streptacidiphilus rugosus]|uniref:GNAT family N-acetyltransferase n=1 Tax=Streptacidiphilus rugosus TaxID=405783 RepID=UPI00068A2F31|nr:GNAT family N-acetyltransferase [Streptacidiphilus rugosus]
MTHGTADLLSTDRIELRPITPAAATALRAGGSGGFTWAPGGPYQGTLDACGALLKAYEGGVYQEAWGAWAIVRRADGAAIGGCGFHGAPLGGVCEIGYDLADSARGQGFATEAAGLVTAYALAQPGVGLVVAHTEPGNLPSQSVLVRAGFTRDGEDGDLFRFVRRS